MLKTLFILGAAWFIGTTVNFYSLMVASAENGMMHFQAYKGKKILIVNTATASDRAGQFAGLQELYTQHQDSLVVIAFPSNSYGNEPRSQSALRSYMRDSLGITFPIAAPSEVAGNNANAVFRWLMTKSQNDVSDNIMSTDFQKFLVDKKGVLVGVFDSSVHPLSAKMQEAVRVSNN